MVIIGLSYRIVPVSPYKVLQPSGSVQMYSSTYWVGMLESLPVFGIFISFILSVIGLGSQKFRLGCNFRIFRSYATNVCDGVTVLLHKILIATRHSYFLFTTNR